MNCDLALLITNCGDPKLINGRSNGSRMLLTCDIQNLKLWQDMLISLNLLIIQRAKMIGFDELANKFDLKMLRAIGMPVSNPYAWAFQNFTRIIFLDYTCKILCFYYVDLSISCLFLFFIIIIQCWYWRWDRVQEVFFFKINLPRSSYYLGPNIYF